MSQASWQEVRAELLAALELTAREQRERLAVLRAATPTVAGEVEALLAAANESADFLEAPAWERASADTGSEAAPERVGPWRIEAEIGRGGMGTVYRAVRDDDQYQKQVAIKLVRGGMDAGFVLQRFRAERQILANLEHPNIARLVDGGTTEEGWPYFSMEYVLGQPIDKYCATLGVRERIELFRTVCAAVQYAHQRLVIHRDLKPSNILVSADGVPKLLDFGIAKLLGADVVGSGEATSTVWPLMTPEYASPEQVKGEAVTTASDVYSLGMLLYLLLAGKRAYEIKTRAPEEVARVVCQQQPEKPSALADRPLSRQLAGDLDTIVLKAIRKEPARRYQTVGELSEDLHRYLAGLPVLARGDTVGYRAGKFVRRHKAAVVVAGLLVVSLLGGIVATVRQARIAEANRARAERERQRAERRFGDVRKLANSFLFEVHDAIADLPGATKARQLLVNKGLEYLDSLAREAAGDVTLQRELAKAYDKLGDLQGRLNASNLGDTAGARDSYRKALAMREALAAAHPMDAEIQLDLALSYDRQGEMRWASGDPAGAAESHQKAVRIGEALSAKSPDDMAVRKRLGISSSQLGRMLAAKGDFAGGLTSVRKGLAVLETLAAATPSDVAAQSRVATVQDMVGEILVEASPDKTPALEAFRRSLAIREALAARDPQNAWLRHSVAVSHTMIGEAREKAGDKPGALASYRQAIATLVAVSDADPFDEGYRQQLAVIRIGAGAVLAKVGSPAEALRELRQALAVLEPLASANPSNQMLRASLANAHTGLAKVEARLGHWREARSWFERSREVWLDLRERGATTGSEAALPDELAREIARCDAALAKLGTAAPADQR